MSVTRNFCKTPMGRASKNRQIKFKEPTAGTLYRHILYFRKQEANMVIDCNEIENDLV